MDFLVQLAACYDGTEPDEAFAGGVVITDRRGDAHDLVAAANARWGTRAFEGEQYCITMLTPTKRLVTVTENVGDSKFTVREV